MIFQPDDTWEVHSPAANRPEAGLCLIAEMVWISSLILLVESKYTSSSILWQEYPSFDLWILWENRVGVLYDYRRKIQGSRRLGLWDQRFRRKHLGWDSVRTSWIDVNKHTEVYIVSGCMSCTTAVLQGGNVAVATAQEKLPRLQRRALHLSEVLDSRTQPRQRKAGHDREHRG